MKRLTASVLVASYRRPELLVRCLRALGRQDLAPDEVVVVWQAADEATRQAVEELSKGFSCPLRAIHSAQAGIVPAENAGLAQATGDVVLLTDDDTIPAPDWVAKHLKHYADPSVGAVGGSARNFDSETDPRPSRTPARIGEITWYGKFHGNMFDHPEGWSTRRPITVQQLCGNNMSLRRSAFVRFEEGLKPYWAMFEADACLQVQASRYRVLFDFSNTVRHFPSNSQTIYGNDRTGDLALKVLNPAFNHAFILAKHSPWRLQIPRLLFVFCAGSRMAPGLLGWVFASMRFGHPWREFGILMKTWRSRSEGWKAGLKARSRPCVVGRRPPLQPIS
jgi:glycosyltransferase involved in cell wall biosynthesis